MELSDAFVYFAFPGCFQLSVIWSFSSEFLGAGFGFSDAARQGFPSWNQTLSFP